MKWTNIKLRVLKKRLDGYIFHDGVGYPISTWGEVLDEVSRVNPGGKVFNPYIGKFTTVSEVEFERSGLKGVKGYYISGFIIHDDQGYYIYDAPSHLIERYNSGQND